MNNLLFYEQRNEILIVLSAAKRYINKPLARIEIQKIIYLVNALSLLRDFILDYFEFKVWHNGPYSKDIQRTLNNLVGQRYIKMEDYKIKKVEGKTIEISSYVIELEGEQVVRKLLNVGSKKEDLEWIQSVVRLVSYYGIDNVVKIVYADPMFKSAKELDDGFGSNLPLYDNEKNKLVNLAKQLKEIGMNDFNNCFKKPSDILLAIFDYLFSEIRE